MVRDGTQEDLSGIEQISMRPIRFHLTFIAAFPHSEQYICFFLAGMSSKPYTSIFDHCDAL